jgi:hypothetical protein
LTDGNFFETVLRLISQMEDTLMGLKQLRTYFGPGIERGDFGFDDRGRRNQAGRNQAEGYSVAWRMDCG